jgi:antagonist of KipI
MAVPIFRVEQPGLLTTVQDRGRIGLQRDGMTVAGAMDPFASQTANILAGNARDAAVLEITLRGPTLTVLENVLIAVCGGDLAARLDGEPLPLWRTARLQAGQTLSFGRRRMGARAYLAVAGGFCVDPVLGSRSTLLRIGIGGRLGRALQPGDELPGMPFSGSFTGRALASTETPVYEEPADIRIIPGPHSEAFAEGALETLVSLTYLMRPDSDRMGYRLSGEPLAYAEDLTPQWLSEAAPCGGIQVPPNGQPILLMVDRQTIGGYPIIAVAASVDIAKAAQAAPGDSLRFHIATIEEAQDLAVTQERLLCLMAFGASAIP